MASLGANKGGNLNIYIFEVGVVNLFELLGVQVEIVSTMTIHPLLVVPTRIDYRDTSRTAISQTAGGSVVTVAGRAFRQVTMQGTFGVDSRGILLYIGNGAMRFQRFLKEVVRMGDAMSQDEVDANTDWINGTPLIPLLTLVYEEEYSTPFINFYDFWNDTAFQCVIRSFNHRRSHREGGASGLVHYTMTIDEAGPLVEGGLGEMLISALMNALTFWDSLNNAIASYTLDVVVGSFTALGAIVMSELADTLAALNAQVEGVQALMGANSAEGQYVAASGTSGLSSYFENASKVAQYADELADQLGKQSDDTAQGETGQADFSKTDSGNRSAEQYSRRVELRDIAGRALTSSVMGVFFGMSEAEFEEYVTASGTADVPRPELGSTTEHTVTETDTPEGMEQTYGVDWGRILALNGLLPHEALIAGTVILIPSVRPTGPQGIDGLPTFGSHRGQAAWGSDIPWELDVDSSGDIVAIEGPDVVVQGSEWIIDLFGADLLQAVQHVPTIVRERYMAKRLAGMFKLDRRITGVREMEVVIGGDGAAEIRVNLDVINGGSIAAGS